jgi:hypothetical protein
MLQSPPGWYDLVPKIELHLHLEGAFPHDALWTLIQKYGGGPVVTDLSALEKRIESSWLSPARKLEMSYEFVSDPHGNE